MLQLIRMTPMRIVARFVDARQAKTARDAISATLAHAEQEVLSLFERQDGAADSLDVAEIYRRHGFTNGCGWQQVRPLFTLEDELFWELPNGMDIEEAKSLLVAFGALAVNHNDERDDDVLRSVPHPAALFLSELENELFDLEDDDLLFFDPVENKKILH